MKTFDEWLQENATMYKGNNASDCMQAAFYAGVAEGTAYAERATAERCIEIIMQWEDAWSVLDFKDAITEEFKLETNNDSQTFNTKRS